MTTNNTENAMGGVTQADLEAAADLGRTLGWSQSVIHEVRSGWFDYWPSVQAFAKHRIAARQAALEEVERACTAAQYSRHPYSDLKQAIRKMRDTPPATNREG